MSDRLHKTLAAIDKLHAEDPEMEQLNGKSFPAELKYAERMSASLKKLVENPSEELQIAVRSQHLCRWLIARKDFPMDKPGYLKWRTELAKMHAEKAGEIMKVNGYKEEEIDFTKKIIRKQNLKNFPEAQTMEDCACLVFLESGFLEFAAKHPEEKVIDILQKTWGKMSAQGQQAALSLNLPSEALTLIQKALS